MKKNRVLINGRFTSHHFAIRNVILNVTRKLAEDESLEVFVVLCKNSDTTDFEKLKVRIIGNPIDADNAVGNHLFTLFILPFILLYHRISLVIYPQICVFSFNPCKTILYIHDLIEYHIENQIRKKMIFRKFVYPYVCKHSDKIIAISESTKKDLIDIFKIAEKKIVVNYDGKDEELTQINRNEAQEYVAHKYGLSNYIFYIGYLTHPQKNLLYLIDEFEKFHAKYSEANLVFAGAKGKNSELILERAEKLPKGSFKYLGIVPYEDLKYLYSACQLFCFPSLFEGFGMPVLEAMSCGAVVITSNTSSLPEIQPDERFLIDPNKENVLTEKLVKYFYADNTKIIEKNIRQAANFSWEKHGIILRNEVKILLEIK